MSTPTAYHQLGKFIDKFQSTESEIDEILILLAKTDPENVLILINKLGYAQRLDTADVMFARFVDLQPEPDVPTKKKFHELIVELHKLGQRRNDLVHSKYTTWTNVAGASGLIRENSKLRAKKGVREEMEEELLPEAFDADIDRLTTALQRLDKFRLKIINWRFPNVPDPG